jgi:DNA-directed RNA polymerase subunit RPC12/RpoP
MADLTFQCQVCRTKLSADVSQVGTLVRCPLCRTTLRVPTPEPAMSGQTASRPGAREIPFNLPQKQVFVPPHLAPRAGLGKQYGFNCVYCSSRLEANESMAAQEGQCPTCGNSIVIPILDRYGRLIDPITKEIIKQDPHPVHAYAAAGDRAPKILRMSDGSQTIECPRCNAMSPITANNCKSCGMPFTMEGTTLEAAGTSNGFCVASLVLGIIGIPGFCIVFPGVIAIVLGIIGYQQVSQSNSENAGKGMAIAGIICGSIGALLSLWVYVLGR